MKKYSKLKYIIRGLFTFIFAFGVIFNSDVYAQEVTQRTAKGTQISDDSTPNSLDPLSFSLLDLSSTERGFLMPRLTTGQRDNIPKQSLTAGLVIYNTTIGCIEFYNTNRQLWMNMCGDVEPAVFTIPLDKCNELKDKISGDYIQGVLLNERRNIISLEVNVSTPGTFEIEAIAYTTTGAENGYSFTARGVFPSSGNFLLVLKGSGTPKVGSADTNVKDTIKFFLNKKEVTCQVQNHVKPDFEPLQAAFVCNDANNKITVEGKYKVDEPLSSANRIIVPFTVTKPGRGKVFGDVSKSGKQTEVIKYESEMIDFRVTDVGRVQTVALYPVYGTGKPTTSGKLTGKLELRSNGKHDYDPFVDPVPAVVESSCGFTINVESDFAKYTFPYSDVIFKSPFKSLTGTGVDYYKSYITPRTKMGANGTDKITLEIDVKVQSAGEFELFTNEMNGVYFKANDIFSTDDIGKTISVTLKAYGESENDSDPLQFIVMGKSFDGSSAQYGGEVYIDFVYQPMKLLSIGNQAWHPAGKFNDVDKAWDGLGHLLSNENHFAWNGKVRVDGFKIFTSIPNVGDGVPTFLLDYMGSNYHLLKIDLLEADMVFIGGRGRFENNSNAQLFPKSDGALQALADYVINDGGVLVYGESKSEYMVSLTKKFGVSSQISANPVTHANAKPGGIFRASSEESKLIRGQVGKNFYKYKNVLIDNRRITGSNHGSEHNNANISFAINPMFYESLINYDNGGTLAFRHTEYPFVGVGNGSFMGGRRSGSSLDGYPVGVDSNREPATTRNTKGDVYNAWFVLNLIHWAIDEAQANKTKGYFK
ncbi:hypothetical protein [Myroides odoratimimus]|uniref:hypothetical protein n=1 Tax=Myroides odoratimimus TaxID=76832 RepID=UPI0031019AF1